MSIFTGSGVALVTPFKKNQEVDYERLDQLLSFHVENETDAIIVCGTTGEAATMTYEEQKECIQFVVEQVGGKIPVIAGTGSNATKVAAERSKAAANWGVDGCLVVTPFYNKATQEGLYQHFMAISDEAKVPMILYNVPGRTGTNLLPETVERLRKGSPYIQGVKEASGNLSQVAKLMAVTEGKIDVYSGNDDQIVPILSLGGKGVISVLANVAPKKTHDICALYGQGKVKESANLQLDAIPLIEALFREVNPIPVKYGMKLIGYDCGEPRLPLTPLAVPYRQELQEGLKKFGINRED